MVKFNILYISTYLWVTTPAGPTKAPRYDLDGNGTPDLCYSDAGGAVHCILSDGSWSIISASRTTLSTPLISTKSTAPRPSVSTLTTASSNLALPTGALPDPATFKAQNGTKWKIEYVGDLTFTGSLGDKALGGDKCRSSVLGEKVIWNCGDMECSGNWQVCGFSMGPAFYGTDSVMAINTTGITHVQDNDFAQAWTGDPAPQVPQTAWGMDTTNVAAINATAGIAYAWEIWRGAPDGSFVDRGNGVVAVTLGATRPIATRLGPLLSGPAALQLGLLAILRDGDYIYSYSVGGPTGIVVGRVRASHDAFDASNYEFLSLADYTTWHAPGTIPPPTTAEYGVRTANGGGKFSCSVYGSVFYNNYIEKYVMLCTAYMSFTNMYVADAPWGPWSAEYGLLSGWGPGYGSHAHPEYSPGGSHKEFYFSQGPNGPFNVFKVTFDF